eukprot:c29033_g1_i1 orf=26-301(+)
MIMSRATACVMKSMAGLARQAGCRSAPTFNYTPALRQASSIHRSRLRGAVVSLLPFHAALSQALFISKLSFGCEDLFVLVQGQPVCTLTIL